MVRVNKMTWDKVKSQYEILKMKSAYILAERAIIANPNLTGFQDVHESLGVITESPETSPEQMYQIVMDELGNLQNLTVKDVQIVKLEQKLASMEETGRRLLKEEKYIELAELKDWYDTTKRQLDKLLGSQDGGKSNT